MEVFVSVKVQGSSSSDPRFSCVFPGSVLDHCSKISGSNVRRPTPDAERQISVVGLHSISRGL